MLAIAYKEGARIMYCGTMLRMRICSDLSSPRSATASESSLDFVSIVVLRVILKVLFEMKGFSG
jgi:hypothetical protein